MISFNSEYNSTFLVVAVVWIILTLEKGIKWHIQMEGQNFNDIQVELRKIKLNPNLC